jgi:hypothetical protein
MKILDHPNRNGHGPGPVRQRRWYNCWLLHSWSLWRREDVEIVSPETGYVLYEETQQSRVCLACNLKQWKEGP